MAGKYKTTGCARFFFFLIILVPLAYFGSKYLMETGIIDNVRDKVEEISRDKSQSKKTEIDYSEATDSDDIKQLKSKIQDLIETIEGQRSALDEKEKVITEKNRIIEQLSSQLGKTVNPTTTEPTKTKKSEDPSIEELLKEADQAIKKN